MNKFGLIPVICHQASSFSPLFTRISKAEAVFWPGCALMTLEPDILDKTLAVLRRAEPEIRLTPACCGNPSSGLFPREYEKRTKKLLNLLKQQGVQRIYTACPNCTLQLKACGLEVHPIWPVLAAHLTQEDMVSDNGTYVWHDPCPTRHDVLQQDAVRQILSLRNCDWIQPEHTGCHTRCCGNKNMLHCTNPEASRKIRKQRLLEFPADRIIASSCEGCLSAFRSEQREAAHLLEILFGRSKSRGWVNRLKNTWN